jgi:hypothetical protein
MPPLQPGDDSFIAGRCLAKASPYEPRALNAVEEMLPPFDRICRGRAWIIKGVPIAYVPKGITPKENAGSADIVDECASLGM